MSQKPRSEGDETVQVKDNRVVVGGWSGDLLDLAGKSGQLRGLLREGKRREAQALMQAQTTQEQAALVLLDENPEEVLGLTGMDEEGRPHYKTAVVEVLPSDLLTNLVAQPGTRHGRFNAEIVRAMSAEAFERTVDDSLDPVDVQADRTQVSWEWMQAVADLEDPRKAADLLYKIDTQVLEDAILDRLEHLGLNDVIGYAGAQVSVFKLFSESGGGFILPPIEDAETAEVIEALHATAPELLAHVVRNAWERAAGGAS